MAVLVNERIVASMSITIDAIQQLQKMIDFYREDKPGPAYLRARHLIGIESGLGGIDIDFQIDRKIMVSALESQRNQLCLSLKENFGVTYSADA